MPHPERHKRCSSPKCRIRDGDPKRSVVIRILLKCKKEGRTRLFNKKPSDFYKRYRQAVSFFNLKHPKPTPHGIRRGGASWHFKLHGSFDRTVEHGRWASVGSARIYINEAAAEESALGSCDQGKRRIADAVQCCPGFCGRPLPSN